MTAQVGTGSDAITVDALREHGGLKWATAGPGKLAACVAEMDFGTAPEIAQALRDAVHRSQFGYLTPAQTARLAEACAAWQHDRYGWDLSPADVRPLPDVIRALHLAIECFSRPGSAVIVPVPAYPPFLAVPRLLGRRVIQFEMVESGGRYGYDLDALDRAFAAGGNLLLVCNPHNPLGVVMEPGELLAVAEVVERHRGRVFSDEVHAPLVYPGHRHVPYATICDAAAGHAVTATSTSKAWNVAGLKCAQMLTSNDSDRKRWSQLGRLHTDGTATLGVLAATTAYRAGGPWLDTVLGRLDGNRRLLADLLDSHLPSARYTPPEGTYLGWLDLRAYPAAGDIAERALVTVMDGAEFGPPGSGFVRLNFATTPAILAEIVRRLARAAEAPGPVRSMTSRRLAP
ncbi:aminotransferase class I/II-fold pyridoxal phosphate-dependent enzyme [Solwaraspora sp. WMMD406]|uniref:MalY/PatB family protein n=1 Tax=Solwaraspora sp. WMMD406 TaxID=3016095 RepID=UPI0024171D87|nr:aminotransferase class I/II-fold pyridoxal phosphate-dependent enzyme [Solwaraspora sp. WMMD406]MDG4767709.1 aminotransferase class I/II-fold pyridoxal phosphate-dependent enzyme [Solwaraspora sp. WMMD406]